MRLRAGNRREKDPFIISTFHELDRALFYDTGLVTEKCEEARDLGLAIPARSQLKIEERFAGMVERTGGAITSVVALFGPVVIMIFVPTLAVTLTVAFAAVCLVAIAVAAFTDLPGSGVMVTSFTYAAVLVVFIGTTLPADTERR
jgi:hypothetical protein